MGRETRARIIVYHVTQCASDLIRTRRRPLLSPLVCVFTYAVYTVLCSLFASVVVKTQLRAAHARAAMYPKISGQQTREIE